MFWIEHNAIKSWATTFRCLRTLTHFGHKKLWICDCKMIYRTFHAVAFNLNKCKKIYKFKTVFNGDTACITQLKQQKSKRCSVTLFDVITSRFVAHFSYALQNGQKRFHSTTHLCSIPQRTLNLSTNAPLFYTLAITFAARRHNVNVLLRNSTFLIFAVLVVWCKPCRR